MNSWPGQSSYPTTVPFNSIQFNTAAMTPASLSPSPSSVSPHEYSSMFHPFNGSMDAEERRHVSSATELSAIGNHCSANSSSVGKNQQSLQREAALNKFRMKRKDRCFEKKVYKNHDYIVAMLRRMILTFWIILCTRFVMRAGRNWLGNVRVSKASSFVRSSPLRPPQHKKLHNDPNILIIYSLILFSPIQAVFLS